MFFGVVLVIGYLFPKPGETLNDVDLTGICVVLAKSGTTCVYKSISHLCVTVIFICSGMKLKTNEIKAALTEWKAVLFGVISILLISPLLTFWTITWDLRQAEFSVGISIFFAQATTLSSGPIIAAQAQGNVALALLLTVFTNIFAVLTMPLFISTTLSTFGNVDVEIDPIPIILQLSFLIIVPLFFGKLLRFLTVVQTFVLKFKKPLKLFASGLLAIIVWMNISKSQNDLQEIELTSILIIFAVGLGLHLVLLLFNFTIATFILRLKQPEKRSVVILTSQKTLPVSLTVLEVLETSVIGAKGLVAIPMITSHFVQIVFDAFLAAYWADQPINDLISIPDDEINDDIEEKNIEEPINDPNSQPITLT